MTWLIRDSIYIDTLPKLVWAVTVDIENWPRWTPTVLEARRLDESAFGLGSEALLRQPALPKTVWRVTEYEAGRYFAWDATVHCLHMRGGHSVIAQGDGTQSTVTLEIFGLMGLFAWPLVALPFRKALQRENNGLKNWCESRETIN